jgi:hypothetical protein
MSITSSEAAVTGPGVSRAQQSSLGRLAGVLGLAQIVIMFAAITQEVMVEHGASLTAVQHDFAGANLTRVFGGGYVESLSFVLLTPAIVIVGRIFGHGSEATRVAAQTFLALGIMWLAATLAVGFAPGAAALYGAQHGADIHSVAMVNDIRNFSYFLQVTIQGGMAVALGVAAILGGLWPRVVGWGGVVVGLVILVGTPFAQNGLGMVWLLWWICVIVLLLKGTVERTSR